MEPGHVTRPDPGDDDDSGAVDLLLNSSSSNERIREEDVSDFSESADEKEDVSTGEQDWDNDRDGNYVDFDRGDEYDDDLARPDPSIRDDGKLDPCVDSENDNDEENPYPRYVEDIVEDEFFPTASGISDQAGDGEATKEMVDYPPKNADDDGEERAPRSGETFDDETSKGAASEETSRERRIITCLSIFLCFLILILIVVSIGVGIGVSRNRNRSKADAGEPSKSPTFFPTASPFPSQFTTFFPTIEDVPTRMPSIPANPTNTVEPTSLQTPDTSSNSTAPPIPPSSEPPVSPSTSPPPLPAPPPQSLIVSPNPVIPPLTAPPSSLTPFPTLQETDLLKLLMERSLDDGQALETHGSSQNEAYQWLRSNAFLSTYSAERVLQRYALAVFFFSTKGNSTWDASIRDDGWLTDAPECEWASTANNQCTGDIYTSLTLDFVGVAGTIPDELSLLTGLTRFSVRSGVEEETVISGTLPDSIGLLTNIQTIRLNNNGLAGPIPITIGLMTNARVLTLAGNNFTGPIPSELSFTQGRTINLDKNNLEGYIPTQLFSMTDLNALNLEYNRLSGMIPSELGTSKSLSSISFSNNNLVGAIPSEIGNLTEIRSSINFSNHRLSGELPSELGRLNRMRSLQLQNNLFVGTVPPEFSGLAGIELFRIDGNPGMFGSIPPEVCLTFGNSTVSYSDCGEQSFRCECCTFCCSEGLCECNIQDPDLCAEQLVIGRVPELRQFVLKKW